MVCIKWFFVMRFCLPVRYCNLVSLLIFRVLATLAMQEFDWSSSPSTLLLGSLQCWSEMCFCSLAELCLHTAAVGCFLRFVQPSQPYNLTEGNMGLKRLYRSHMMLRTGCIHFRSIDVRYPILLCLKCHVQMALIFVMTDAALQLVYNGLISIHRWQ